MFAYANARKYPAELSEIAKHHQYEFIRFGTLCSRIITCRINNCKHNSFISESLDTENGKNEGQNSLRIFTGNQNNSNTDVPNIMADASSRLMCWKVDKCIISCK